VTHLRKTCEFAGCASGSVVARRLAESPAGGNDDVPSVRWRVNGPPIEGAKETGCSRTRQIIVLRAAHSAERRREINVMIWSCGRAQQQRRRSNNFLGGDSKLETPDLQVIQGEIAVASAEASARFDHSIRLRVAGCLAWPRAASKLLCIIIGERVLVKY
jgi:hypothetical protein